VTIINRI